MKTMKDYCPKPSDAVRAMIDGLWEQDAREDFVVDMSVFGSSNQKLCFGCAATCAVQKATGVNFQIGEVEHAQFRSDRIEVDRHELLYFESCIDQFRKGGVYALHGYYCTLEKGFNLDLCKSCDFYLETENWKQQMPKVEAYYQKLITAGL